MKTSNPVPTSLEGWIKQLDSVRLPIPAASHGRVRRALGDSRRSLREIADMIQDSPALALSLMREANRTATALGGPADSLEVALTRLGLKRSEELLSRLPAVAEHDIPLPLRQIQLISQHASQQANGLFAARLARLWQEIHWNSLLFLSPIWPLLALHPELFTAWEKRVLVNGEAARKVERELLGVPVLRLCQALAEHWRLPEWITEGYRLLNTQQRMLVKALHIARDNEHPLHQQHLLDADTELRRWLTQPANTVLLANGLAISAHNAWTCDHSLRWQRLTGLYMQLPLADVQQLIHQQAAESARKHATPDLWHPAQSLIWPWGTRRWPAEAAKPAPPPPAALQEWRTLCTQLLKEPSPFANIVQLTACARDALAACGMQRSLLLLVDKTQTRLMVQQSGGLPKEVASLQLDPAQSQVLRRLLAQPGQLRLSPENAAQYSPFIPGNLKALFPADHLLLRSVAASGRVVLLVIADQGGQPFSDISLQAFGKTMQCIERALHGFASRGR